MKIMLLLTADYASLESASGKLNVIGAFSNIWASKFPHVHKRLALVVKVRAELGDHHNERILGIDMVDEDENRLFHISGPFQFPQNNKGLLGEHYVVLELNNLKFIQPGIYNFVVYVDGERLGGTPIDVALISQPLE